MQTFAPHLILCPTDFSESASLALRYAAEFSRSAGCELLVIYADEFTPPPYFTSDQVDELIGERRRAKRAAESHLERYVRSILPGGPAAQTAIVEEGPVSSILRTAKERGADLIVMGGHGTSGFNRFMLGSVTERVLRESEFPVLFVRKRKAESITAIKHVLCPVNFSGIALEAFRYAVDVAEMFRAELIALHVVEPGGSDMEKGELAEKLCNLVSDDARNTCTLNHVVRKGNASEQILETAAGLSCDLIVLGVEHKRFFDSTVIGSTTARVTSHAPCPVFAVTSGKRG